MNWKNKEIILVSLDNLIKVSCGLIKRYLWNLKYLANLPFQQRLTKKLKNLKLELNHLNLILF